jgi:hypothetical protein
VSTHNKYSATNNKKEQKWHQILTNTPVQKNGTTHFLAHTDNGEPTVIAITSMVTVSPLKYISAQTL